MDAPPPRLIAHVFAETSPPPETVTKLYAQLAQVCAREGSRLVDLIFDRELPDRQPSDYPSLVRIASGEADGIVIARLPLSMEARPTSDLLCSALAPPLCMYNAAELEIRGLLPAARLIDPAAATLAAVERAWGLLGHVRSDMFLTTGDPEAMRAAAAAAFGVALPAVQRVGL